MNPELTQSPPTAESPTPPQPPVAQSHVKWLLLGIVTLVLLGSIGAAAGMIIYRTPGQKPAKTESTPVPTHAENFSASEVPQALPTASDAVPAADGITTIQGRLEEKTWEEVQGKMREDFERLKARYEQEFGARDERVRNQSPDELAAALTRSRALIDAFRADAAATDVVRYENKDLGLSFLYPKEWGQLIIYATPCLHDTIPNAPHPTERVVSGSFSNKRGLLFGTLTPGCGADRGLNSAEGLALMKGGPSSRPLPDKTWSLPSGTIVGLWHFYPYGYDTDITMLAVRIEPVRGPAPALALVGPYTNDPEIPATEIQDFLTLVYSLQQVP